MRTTKEQREALRLYAPCPVSMPQQWSVGTITLGVLADLAEAEARAENAISILAGIADVVNEELRANGPIDVQQMHGPHDARPFIRRLVDLVRQRTEARAEKAERNGRPCGIDHAATIAALGAVEDERDRYKAALEEIAWHTDMPLDALSIARAALSPPAPAKTEETP